MKKITFLIAFIAIAIISRAQVLLESFDYTAGTALTANGWTAHSAAGTNPILVGATSLTMAQYSPTSVGGSAVSAGNSEDVNAYFSPIKNGNVYASFLLRVDTIGAEGYFFHFLDSASSSAHRARTFFKVDASNPNAFNLGLSFNASSGTNGAVFDTTEFVRGSTILVVVKYTINSGLNNDAVSLYAFNATGSFATEPATPLLGPVTYTGTSAAADIQPSRIALRQYNALNDFAVDAFSVNTVWNMSPTFVLAPINLPITWDDANVDYTVTDFGGDSSLVVADPMNASNLVLMSIKKSNAANWAGTTLSTPAGLATAIPFAAGSTKISAVIMSPNVGITVRMKVEDHTNPNIYVEVDKTITVANQWDTLVFDFANAATTPINFANTYDKISIFYDFLVAPATPAKSYYLDNVFFGGTTAPTIAQIDLPITWDDATTVNYATTDFGGNTSSVVVSPTLSTNNVLQVIKGAGATTQPWAGTTLSTAAGFANAIPFSTGNTTVKVAFWSPAVGVVVRLKAENHLNNAVYVETDVTTTVAGWDTLSFNFANNASTPINFSNTYDMLSIFCGFGTPGGASAITYYVDNVWFTGVVSPPPSNTSPYCNTQVFHFGLPAEVASSVFLTIKNVSSSSMEVIIESATSDPVDDLILAGPAGGGAISAIDTPATGQLRRTITWAGATPPTVDFNVLWSKVSFPGNWQLLPSGSLAIPFAATCSTVITMKSQIDLPITWDDTANVDYTVTDFEGNSSTHVVDPTNASNMVLKSTKTSGGQPWAGTTLSIDSTGLATAIPFSPGNTKISVAVWSPDANIPVRLKAEDKTDNTKSVETEVMTMVAGAWDTLVFDFANHATNTAAINFTYTYNKLSIFYDFLTAPATPAKSYYCDDVFFGGGAPPTGLAQINLPITWDDTANVNYTVTDFGGDSSLVVIDPMNASNLVLKTTKKSSAQSWAGTTLSTTSGLATAIPFSASATTISAVVYSPQAGIIIRLKAENKANSAIFVEAEAMVTSANAWDTVVFDFSNNVTPPTLDTSKVYDLLSIFYDFNIAPSTPAKAYYLDNVFFGGASVPPTVMHDVTFRVDLSKYTGAYSVVNLNGTFNNWCGSCAVMTDANNDSIYELVVSLPANDTSEYKFTLDAWTVQEQLTQGAPCTKTTIDAGGTFTNRFVVPTSDTTLVAVCWESCSSCSGIGLEENIWADKLVVSPNPSTGLFNITGLLKKGTQVDIVITNIQGQVIYKSSTNTQALDQTLNLETAANGMYLVNIITDFGTYSEKILISK